MANRMFGLEGLFMFWAFPINPEYKIHKLASIISLNDFFILLDFKQIYFEVGFEIYPILLRKTRETPNKGQFILILITK